LELIRRSAYGAPVLPYAMIWAGRVRPEEPSPEGFESEEDLSDPDEGGTVARNRAEAVRKCIASAEGHAGFVDNDVQECTTLATGEEVVPALQNSGLGGVSDLLAAPAARGVARARGRAAPMRANMLWLGSGRLDEDGELRFRRVPRRWPCAPH
jgi:hypothetical protein